MSDTLLENNFVAFLCNAGESTHTSVVLCKITSLTGCPLCTNGSETVYEVSGRVTIQERHDQAEKERR